MPKHVDVCIIGGGTIGSSIAYYLSKTGLKVLLIEKNSIGSGSARANFGLVTAQLFKYFKSIHPEYFALKVMSLEIYTELERELQADIEYRKTGGLVVIKTEKELEEKKKLVRTLRSKGLEIHLLSREETLELEPVLYHDILGASYCPDESEVNPLRVAGSFIKAGRKNGLEVMENTPALSFLIEGNRVSAVRIPGGNITVNWVVNAGGAWAPDIAAKAGVEIPMSLQRGQLLVTDSVPRMLNRAVQHIPVVEVDDKQRNVVLSEEIRQMRSGNLIIGGTREYEKYSLDTTFEGITDIARRAVTLVPKLRETNIIRTFSGIRNIPVDGFPVLGFADQLSGWVNAVCHAGIGLAPAVGQLTADLITKGRTSLCLDPFNIRRFKSARVSEE